MLKLMVIGCSSGDPHPDKACSSYLVEAGRTAVLFDIGEGANSAMRRVGIDPRRVGAIVLSHMHADHVMGLPLFIQSNYIRKRRAPLTIFAPSESIAGLKQLFDLTYLYPLKVGFPVRFVALKPVAAHRIGSLTFRPHANRHLERHREIMKRLKKANRAQCYSFAIQAGRRRILYSADLGSVHDIVGLLAETHLLVIEASHVDFGELGRLLEGVSKIRVLITHADDDFDFASAKRILKRAGITSVALAQEGQRWEL